MWRLLLAIASLTACVMAFLPHPPRVPGDPPDTILHALAFAALALLARMSFRSSSAWIIALCLAGLGLVIEFVQSIPALGREASLRDWVVDVTVSVTVLALLPMLGLGRRRHMSILRAA
jgi:VanZ family protein